MLDTSRKYALIDKIIPAMIVPSPTKPVKINVGTQSPSSGSVLRLCAVFPPVIKGIKLMRSGFLSDMGSGSGSG